VVDELFGFGVAHGVETLRFAGAQEFFGEDDGKT
jgi:hypothetical protein